MTVSELNSSEVRISKPAAISHADDKDNRTCIYSLDIHPTIHTKLVTGGLDSKVRIWNIDRFTGDGIVELAGRKDHTDDVLLSTLSLHNGAVMCVRFNPDGQFLASGSDGDNIIIIWERDHSGYRGGTFGSKEVNKESWKCTRRLSGHKSDVVDIQWSPDFRFLASCGLDNTVIIWDADSFEIVTRLTAHDGFVKGVCWDPIGKFLATQSDDRSILFWNVFDWSIAKRLEEGFEKSFGQTFFKRLAWSPDGSQICGVHAVDKSKVLSTASIINRDGFEEDACLVGFRGVVECANFNPKLFVVQAEDDDSFCVCALGSQEGTISIWLQNSARSPLVVEQAFSGPVYDLSWSSDGRTLAACGADGTVIFLRFGTEALGALADDETVERKLSSLGYEPRERRVKQSERIVESVSVMDLMNQATPASPPQLLREDKEASHGNAFNSTFAPQHTAPTHPVNSLSAQRVTKTKEGKRRIQPMLLSSPSNPGTGYGNALAFQTTPPTFSMDPAQTSEKRQKVDLSEAVYHCPPEALDLKKLPVKASLVLSVEIGRDKFGISVDNPIRGSRKRWAEVSATRNGENLWTNYLEHSVVALGASSSVVAVACSNNSIVFWSPSGRRILSSLSVESAAHQLLVSDGFCLCVTSRGSLWLWDIPKQRVIYEQLSLAPIMKTIAFSDTSEILQITGLRITPKGLVLVSLSDRITYTFHLGLKCWVQAESTTRWELESDFLSHLPVDYSKQEFFSKKMDLAIESAGTVLRSIHGSFPPSVQESLSLAAMEERISVALAMKERDVFYSSLISYAKRMGVCTHGHSAKATDLLENLIGQPSEPDILGYPRMELLKGVLPLLSVNTELQRVVSGYSGRLS